MSCYEENMSDVDESRMNFDMELFAFTPGSKAEVRGSSSVRSHLELRRPSRHKLQNIARIAKSSEKSAD
jgi:hypothetical protein